jgi:Uma2 family endonuclease
MSTQPKPHFTVEEYLAIERAADYKSEYFEGEIFAMAGASRKHNLITLNVGSNSNQQLKERECEVYVSAMRVRVRATDLLTYPDVVVVCGEPQFNDEESDTLLNPTLIVEVLSKSTKNFDRGDKFEQYRTMESFSEYLLIAQDKIYAEQYIRQNTGDWLLKVFNQVEDTIQLASIQCRLPIGTIYSKVKVTD